MGGAGVALLAMSEPLRWIVTPGPTGSKYTIVPDGAGIPLQGRQSGGCTGVAITVAGFGTAVVLAIGAVALAALGAGATRYPVGAHDGG